VNRTRQALTVETPKDQEWVSHPQFEEELYRRNAHFPDVKPITHGPQYHWFGYYDKFSTDPEDRFVLSMQVDFDDRSPKEDDFIRVGLVDIEDSYKWTQLGKSRAWCWQQGCMLQWRPGSTDEVMWNDRSRDRFVCHIVNVQTGDRRTLDFPVYHVRPDGKDALVADFSRIQSLRPGYGYPGIPDKSENISSPEEIGISIANLETGKLELLFSVKDIASIPYEDPAADDMHYFNHLAWNTDGSRFLFLHRWRSAGGRFPDFRTRMFTAAANGSDVRLVTDKPYVSHFTWRDPEHIAIWRENSYKLYKDDGSGSEETILNAPNGHHTYLQGNQWMIADTYADKDGCQNPFLFHVGTGRIVPLGHFQTLRYTTGELRCDLHPRIIRDGKRVIIDSTHGGNGRQQYLFDIADYIG